jgi:methenyltetrahydrofolate cyclohydrolase
MATPSVVVHSSHMETIDFMELRMQDFLGQIAAEEQSPGGGSAAAVTVAMAAGLVAMVARCSKGSWPDAPGVAAQALQIQKRAGLLASADATAWDEALDALRRAKEGEGTGDDAALQLRLERAAAVPLEIAQLAADVADLAALAGEHCEGTFQADAAAAAALAAGAARAALHLVEVNLGVREGDARLKQAREIEQAAASASERVLGSIR